MSNQNKKMISLTAKSVEELKAERLELLSEQFKLRMQRATGELSKPHQFNDARKQIARINTILSSKAGK